MTRPHSVAARWLLFAVFVLLLSFPVSLLPSAAQSTSPLPLPLPLPSESAQPRALRGIAQAQKLVASNGAANDEFGSSVAMSADGKTLLIGVPFDDVTFSDQGSVYVYRWETTQWVEQEQLIASDGQNGDWFGYSVALSADGNTALIGSPRDTVSLTFQGSAYIFRWDGANWVEEQKLIASDAGLSDSFGSSVALSADSNIALVGAPEDDRTVPFANAIGSAYMFEWNGATWSEQQKLTASDGAADDKFGTVVALSATGAVALVGAPFNDFTNPNQGTAYVFVDVGASWSQQERLRASDNAADDQFGSAVALSADGSTALIGAPLDDNTFSNEGSAYLFKGDIGGGIWTQEAKFTNTTPAIDDQFGDAVALNPDATSALIGSPLDNVTQSDQGSATLYTYDGTSWLEGTKLVAADAAANDRFGNSVAFTSNASIMLIGAFVDDLASNINQGSAYTFWGSFDTCSSVFTIPIPECDALVALYTSTVGANWTNNDGWLSDANPCSWHGITCANGHVSEVFLENNNLNGTIPSSLASLSQLEGLILNLNKLSGTLPLALTTISTLTTLEAHSNTLSGTLAPELGDLANLRTLYLAGNNLSGEIPTTLGNLNELLFLGLCYNQLTGTIPSSLSNLTNLEYLYLCGNDLSGEIPAAFANLGALQPAQANNTFFGYNSLTTDDAPLIAFLETVDPTWDETQTIAPSNVTVSASIAPNPIGLRVSWTPILYTTDSGYYKVVCTSPTTGELSVNTADKTSTQVIFSGIPSGLYTCRVDTTTLAHTQNKNIVTSRTVNLPEFNYTNPLPNDTPSNDLYQNPLTLDQLGQQDYSFNIANATADGDPRPPIFDNTRSETACEVTLTENAAAIHYRIPGSNLGDDIVTINSGGPGWYRSRNLTDAADTAIVVFEELATGEVGAVVACDDDNAPGEISVSTAVFQIDPAKNYRVVVWNEATAAQGAVIEIRPATFSLLSPFDNEFFLASGEPTVFTWEADPEAVKYTFEIARSTQSPLSLLALVELTPNGLDDDGLSCDATLCTLTIAPNSDLEDYLQVGNFIWSVTAKTAQNIARESTQIWRLLIGIVPPAENLAINSSMELDLDADKIPDGWTLKNGSSDLQKCNKQTKVVAYQGECTFRFRGGANEGATLEQFISSPQLAVGSQLKFSAFVQVKGMVPANIKVKFNARIEFEDGTRQKLNVAFPPNAEIGVYLLVESDALVFTKPVSQVRIRFRNLTPSGTVWVDVIEVYALSDVMLTETRPDASGSGLGSASATNGLVPLPPAADAPEIGSR